MSHIQVKNFLYIFIYFLEFVFIYLFIFVNFDLKCLTRVEILTEKKIVSFIHTHISVLTKKTSLLTLNNTKCYVLVMYAQCLLYEVVIELLCVIYMNCGLWVRRFLTAADRVQSSSSPCEICGEQSHNDSSVSLCTSISSCQYHSTLLRRKFCLHVDLNKGALGRNVGTCISSSLWTQKTPGNYNIFIVLQSSKG